MQVQLVELALQAVPNVESVQGTPLQHIWNAPPSAETVQICP
jgi:hypothetical protein